MVAHAPPHLDLRDLPPVYARPIPAEVDVSAIVAEARLLAVRIEANDAADRLRPQRRLVLRELDAGAEALEQADAALTRAVAGLEKERMRVAPAERERAARYAVVLAVATHPRGSADERALYDATRWLRGLDAPTASRVIVVMRREKDVLDADDMRCRAYHALRVAMRRAGGP